jgi:hypothetical protein
MIGLTVQAQPAGSEVQGHRHVGQRSETQDADEGAARHPRQIHGEEALAAHHDAVELDRFDVHDLDLHPLEPRRADALPADHGQAQPLGELGVDQALGRAGVEDEAEGTLSRDRHCEGRSPTRELQGPGIAVRRQRNARG